MFDDIPYIIKADDLLSFGMIAPIHPPNGIMIAEVIKTALALEQEETGKSK